MSVEPGMLDANVLVYAVEASAPQHANSRALIEAARDPASTLYLTSQALCEFYSMVTNPRRVAVSRSSAEAVQAISAFLPSPGIHVLSTPSLGCGRLDRLAAADPAVLAAEIVEDLQAALDQFAQIAADLGVGERDTGPG
jgi:predicted nucleic acid-binding protein